MTTADIRNHRLSNQQLTATKLKTPQQMASHFGAIQAQDYAMAKWAIGLRLGIAENEVENAVNSGEILRTHILRPTWHFVASSDIHWMLELTSPHVKSLLRGWSKKYNLDEATLLKYNNRIEKLLSGNTHLTREEIIKELDLKDNIPGDIRPAIIMMNFEQDGLICSGAMRGKQFTYALLHERVQPSKTLDREEALAKLAKRYFSSHGPASLADFAWWSGLSLSNSRLALELVKSELSAITIENQPYWFYDIPLGKSDKEVVHLLPAFDEFLISYKDRTASIITEHQPKAFTKNGIFYPVIAIDGVIEGVWKRVVKKDKVHIEVTPFRPLENNLHQEIIKETRAFGDFLGKETVVSMNL